MLARTVGIAGASLLLNLGAVAVTPAAPCGDEIRRASEKIAFFEARAEKSPGSWIDMERAAAAYTERARLSGRLTDLAFAEDLLERAFAAAPDGAGPHLTQARLDFTLHRFDRVEARLAAAERRIVLDDPTRAAILGMRGDLAFQEHRLDDAVRLFEEALDLHESPEGLSRLAKARDHAGRTAEADSLFAAAAALEHGPAGWSRAWIALQRGQLRLNAGDAGGALEHFRAAENLCPGWWQTDRLLAAALAEQGETDAAITRITRAAETSERPATLRAAADLLAGAGRPDEAREWNVRAHRVEHDLADRFPEIVQDACGRG
ncbi:MAG: tetratricopeptide repeat protein, partial [Gemmatimonadetes bacterium]|nr:tetratricopeptide repeat protein [Gemmatimonadota bacterium]